MEGLESVKSLEDVNLDEEVAVEKRIQPGAGLDTHIPIQLPDTLYSSLIILPLCETLGKTKWNRALINFSLYWCMAANFTIQGFFLRYVYKIYVDSTAEYGVCGGRETDTNLRIFCILVYTAYCFADVAETMKMSSFVFNFPECAKFQKLELKQVEENGETELVFASGMTKMYKLYCFLCILFPKFVIACSLLTYGTGFVVTTDANENLILNALALGFVLEIDDMAYEYFMTFQMRAVVSQLPAIEISASMMMRINTHYGTVIKAVILITLTLGTLNAYCPNP